VAEHRFELRRSLMMNADVERIAGRTSNEHVVGVSGFAEVDQATAYMQAETRKAKDQENQAQMSKAYALSSHGEHPRPHIFLGCSPCGEKADMLWTILIVLLILWLLGFSLHVGGALIHLLLVVALVVLVFNLVTGRRQGV